MPTAARQRRSRVRESTLWAAVAVALVVHGLVFREVHALGLSLANRGSAARSKSKTPDERELQATCAGDVALASAGRFATCLAPWVSDLDQCISDQQMNLWIDLSSCQARTDPGTAVAMIEPRTTEKLKEIDPEKLLDEVEQQKKQQPPPPIPPPQPATAQPPPPPPQAQQRPQQVVEVVKPKTEQEPENARFLSEYNVNVDKQKVARGTAQEPLVAKSKPAELTPKDKPKDEPSIKQREPDRMPGKAEKAPDVPGTLSMRTPGAQSPAETDQEHRVRGSTTGALGALVADGLIPRKGQGALDQEQHQRSEIPRGAGGAGGGAPKLPDLKPSQDVLERVVGGGSVDHLDDVENGDETALSSKRWVYASFFNRLKRQVAQNWDPASVWRRSDPTGTVYGFKTRVTEVRVSLSSKGDLEKIVVTAPSGVSELDDEAVRAFKAAAPFPNPPDGLVQKDNLITFAFSFYFEIGSPHTSWRLIRSM